MPELFDRKGILELEELLNIEFSNRGLLQRAVTHKSFPNENRELNLKNNERLEFLGDSVLGLAISTYIFQEFPEFPEGELAKMRAVIVSAPVLAKKARELNIGDFLLLGKGEEMTGGRERDSILADTMEAIIGAIYLEKGLDRASSFVLNLLKTDIEAVEKGKHIKDYKTMLQEYIQQDSNNRPIYSVIEEKGPDHNKIFKIKVEFKDKQLGIGTGSSKKNAQQKAARAALENLGEL